MRICRLLAVMVVAIVAAVVAIVAAMYLDRNTSAGRSEPAGVSAELAAELAMGGDG